MELALTKLIGPGPISTVSQCMMDLMEVARAHDHVLLLLIPLETLLTMMRPPRSICRSVVGTHLYWVVKPTRPRAVLLSNIRTHNEMMRGRAKARRVFNYPKKVRYLGRN